MGAAEPTPSAAVTHTFGKLDANNEQQQTRAKSDAKVDSKSHSVLAHTGSVPFSSDGGNWPANHTGYRREGQAPNSVQLAVAAP